MKKLVCILITVALIASFAVMLVACDKTETHPLGESDIEALKTAVNATRAENYYRVTVTVNMDDETSVTTLSVHNNAKTNNAPTITVERNVSGANGESTYNYTVIGKDAFGSVIYAFETRENDKVIESVYESSSSAVAGEIKEASGCDEPIHKLLNIISGYYEIANGSVETHTKSDDVTYTFDYDDEVNESGKVTVKVSGGRVTYIAITVNGGESVTAEYSAFSLEDMAPMSRDEWFAAHPEPTEEAA